MTLEVGVNSYMSVSDANDIVDSLYMSTDKEKIAWDGLSDNDKAVLIYRYTQKVDSDKNLFIGIKKDIAQTLSFPRIAESNGRAFEIPCPNKIKQAIIIQCVRDLAYNSGTEAELRKQGIESFSDGGGASIKFNSSTFKNTGSNVCGLDDDIWSTYIQGYTIIS